MSTQPVFTQQQIETRRQYRTSLWDVAPNKTGLVQPIPTATSKVENLKRLYVGNLAFDTTEEDIRKVFATVGDVTKIELHKDPLKGTLRGFCFVEYSTAESAKLALETFNGFILHDRALKVSVPTSSSSQHSAAASSAAPQAMTRVFVGQIDQSITEAHIRDLFAVFGTVRSVQFIYNPSGQHRGYGFVDFDNEASAQQAIEKLNKFQLKDKQLVVAPANAKTSSSSQMHSAPTHPFPPPPLPLGVSQPFPPPPVEHGFSGNAVAAVAAAPHVCMGPSVTSMIPPTAPQFASPSPFAAAVPMTGAAMAPALPPQPTNILLLQNMITADKYALEDPAAFEEAVKEGCADFGAIQRVSVIPRADNRVDVFVMYSNANEAAAAQKALDKKKFDTSIVHATFAQAIQ